MGNFTMKVEHNMLSSPLRMTRQRSEVSGGAETFASILSSTQAENAEEKTTKTGNPLGLSDEEYRTCLNIRMAF